MCPSDPTYSNGYPVTDAPGGLVYNGFRAGQAWGGGTSYGANVQMFGTGTPGGNARNSNYNIGNIPDGTSNTIGFAEVYAGPQLASNPAAHEWAYPYVYSPKEGPQIGDVASYGAQAEQPPQPCPTKPSAADGRLSQSAHTGLVLVGLMDGSVRGVSNSITPATWWSALQPGDGVPLGSDW